MQEVSIKSDYELERGKPIPSKNHGFIQTKLAVLISKSCEDKYEVASEINVLINGNVKVPDLAIFQEATYTPGYDEINVEEIPVGVIEILSPKQSLADLIVKSYQYFEAGVKSYWLALPETQTIYVYYAPNEYYAYFQKGTLVDNKLGIEIDVAKVFKVKK